jgi:hypothetical protein
VPALLPPPPNTHTWHAGHARDDTFIARRHSELLVAAYGGDKEFVTFSGDHNSGEPSGLLLGGGV